MKRQDGGFSMAAAQADRRKRKFALEAREASAVAAADKVIAEVEKRGIGFAPMETGFDRYVIKLLKAYWLGGSVRWSRTGGTKFVDDGQGGVRPETTEELMCFALARKPS